MLFINFFELNVSLYFIFLIGVKNFSLRLIIVFLILVLVCLYIYTYLFLFYFISVLVNAVLQLKMISVSCQNNISNVFFFLSNIYILLFQ